ncbi:MAG: TatD family hydrolase [bacterium]|nr:TatD family hydrolase [Myxococcales bacterium]MCB9542452.1 TatD family hydrolase [Myxococcales bacterium]
MRIFEPHIHCYSRTTDDYERMALAGIEGVCEPAFWLGQPRTHAATFKDYFDTLLGWERHRAAMFGIRHYCTMGLNPKEANDTRFNDEVVELVREYVHRDGVIAVGEIGYDDMTPTEERIFQAQIEIAIAAKKPILIHTPHRDKTGGVKRTLDVVRESGIEPSMVLVDHNTEMTIPMVKETGYYAGFSIYPNTKMSPERMVEIFRRFGTERMIINSAADWGVSDPLLVPKTVQQMRKAGMDEDEIERVVWRNPIGFFAQSGQIGFDDFDRDRTIDRSRLHEGNSVLRGQTP